MVSHVASDLVIGLELVRENAVAALQHLIGPANSLTAKSQNPNSIRAIFGKDSLRNAVHGSESIESA